jgi:hypothetical protein
MQIFRFLPGEVAGWGFWNTLKRLTEFGPDRSLLTQAHPATVVFLSLPLGRNRQEFLTTDATAEAGRHGPESLNPRAAGVVGE